MIKINLLQERKKARRAPKGQNELAIGFAAIAAAGAAIFFLVHSPLSDEIAKKKAASGKLKSEIKDLEAKTKDFDAVNKQAEALEAQAEAIQRLNDARAVPAWFLFELSRILTKGKDPTMTEEMIELVKIRKDPNRTFREDWDPKRVWIDKIEEKDGKFTLTGGAQADTDMTQLALRLQASVFFQEVTPEGGNTAEEKKMKVQYYQFKITGRVVY